MGIFDGAANGLSTRLEKVGVPQVIAYVISQVAYISPRKRHPNIPDSVLSKSEVTWLVSQYERQLADVFDPVTRAALVQGLCVKIFGPNAEEIFVAGYPELGTQESVSTAADDDVMSFERQFSYALVGNQGDFSREHLEKVKKFALAKAWEEVASEGYSPVPGSETGEAVTLFDAKRAGLGQLHDVVNLDREDGWLYIAEVTGRYRVSG